MTNTVSHYNLYCKYLKNETFIFMQIQRSYFCLLYLSFEVFIVYVIFSWDFLMHLLLKYKSCKNNRIFQSNMIDALKFLNLNQRNLRCWKGEKQEKMNGLSQKILVHSSRNIFFHFKLKSIFLFSVGLR